MIVPDFFEQQRRMRVRSVVLLVGIFVLLVAVVSLPLIGVHSEEECPPGGTPCETTYRLDLLALALTALGVLLYLLVAPRIALLLAARRNTAVGGEPARRVSNVVEEISIAAGVPMPTCFVVDDGALNAFAMPVAPHGAVVVTSGMVDALDRRELSGVVAHEIGHLRNRDSRVVLVAAVAVALIVRMQRVCSTIAVGAVALARASQRKDKSQITALLALGLALAVGVLAAVLTVVALPLALLMRAALSRRREQLADAAAVQYTRDPGGLRTALEKIAASAVPERDPSIVTQPLWIDAPTRLRPGDWIARLIATHPPIEERIAWLRALEGASAAGG